MSPLVAASNLTKVYPKVVRRRDRLSAMMRLLLGRQLPAHLSAPVLQSVSLSVNRGESLAIVGENGAGKSTLLKLLTGVLTPSRGSVEVSGSVGALLELGAGFHQEYTGRENLQLAGTLYGFSGAELRAKLEEIITFADIGHYLDEPVKHYSSGMVVRLGFALLAARRPDLLITDEVLAVGDESFQKKCVRWIEDYLTTGGTLMLVSHSMYHVQKLCKHALWLRNGVVAGYGDVFDVTQEYLAYHEKKSNAEQEQAQAGKSLGYKVERLLLNGKSTAITLEMQQELRVEIELLSPDDRIPTILVGIVRADGTPIYGVTTDFDKVLPTRIAPQRYAIVLEYSQIPLLPGHYALRAHAMDPEGVRLFDSVVREFSVRGESREFGLIRLAHSWSPP